MTNSKFSKSDKTKKIKFTLIKKNFNYDPTQKLKLWQNSKTQIMTKLNNSNCDKNRRKLSQDSHSNCAKTETQIVTKLKNKFSDKTQTHYFGENHLTPQQLIICT